jgi:hypothetical protein
MAALENRPNTNRELPPAIIALFQAKTFAAFLILYAFERGNAPHATTMRTYRTVAPDNCFQRLKCGGFILKVRLFKNAGHDRSSRMDRSYPIALGLSTRISPIISA